MRAASQGASLAGEGAWRLPRQYHQSHPSPSGHDAPTRSARVEKVAFTAMTATPPGRPAGRRRAPGGDARVRVAVRRGRRPSPLARRPGKHRAGDATPTRSRSPSGSPSAARRQPPEETQVMPIQPPVAVAGRRHRPRAPRAAEVRAGAPDRRARPPGRPRRRWRRHPGRGSSRRGSGSGSATSFLLLLLWLVFLVVVPLVAWNKVTKVDAMPDGDRPGDQPGTTYLLVGSDSRADLTAEERKELNTGGAGGQRTDTIMLLHTGSGPNLLMSIPRDSLVPIPGHGTTKINAAYAFGGPKLLVRTIEAEHRHPHRQLRRDRLRRLRRAGRRRRRHRDLPPGGHGRRRRRPQHQEGLPGRRRQGRPRRTRARATPSSSATSTAPPTSARSSPPSARRRSRHGR